MLPVMHLVLSMIIGIGLVAQVTPDGVPRVDMTDFTYDIYPSDAEVISLVQQASEVDSAYTPDEFYLRNTAWDRKCGFESAGVETTICTFGDQTSTYDIAVIGSSQAVMWIPTFHRLGLQHGGRIHSYTKPTCPPTETPVYTASTHSEYTDCTAFVQWTIRQVIDLQPEMVVLVAGWMGTGQWTDTEVLIPGDPQRWADGLDPVASAIAAGLDPAHTRLVMIGDAPQIPPGIADCLLTSPNRLRDCGYPRPDVVRQVDVDLQRGIADRYGYAFVDVTDWLCGSEVCSAVVRGIPVRLDGNHINVAYAIWLQQAMYERIMGWSAAIPPTNGLRPELTRQLRVPGPETALHPAPCGPGTPRGTGRRIA